MTTLLAVMYFGFMLLVAFATPLLSTPIFPGITLAILIGAGMILASWLLGWAYVAWANRHHDPACDRLR